MIYVVDVKLYYTLDLKDVSYIKKFRSVENVVSETKITYDRVIEIALAEAFKDLKDIYKIDEECVKYSKASVVGVVENEYFKD